MTGANGKGASAQEGRQETGCQESPRQTCREGQVGLATLRSRPAGGCVPGWKNACVVRRTSGRPAQAPGRNGARSVEAQRKDQLLARVLPEAGSIRSSSDSRSSTLPTPGTAASASSSPAPRGQLADAQLDSPAVGRHREGDVAVAHARGRVRGERVAEDHRVVQAIHRAIGAGEHHRDHATQHRSGQWPVRQAQETGSPSADRPARTCCVTTEAGRSGRPSVAQYWSGRGRVGRRCEAWVTRARR